MILDESVLRRAVGGPAVMRAQLACWRTWWTPLRTTLQVLPFAHGGHALMGGSLAILTLDDGTAVAYEESIDYGHIA